MHRTLTFLSALLISLSAPARAQGTSAHVDTVYWKASGELAFTDVSGNRTLSLLTTGLRANLVGHRVVELSTVFGVRYGRSNGDVAAENYDAQVDLRFLPRRSVSPFVSGKASRDPVRNLNLRVSAALGADFNLFQRDDQRLSLGVALLQDYENRDIPAGASGASEVSLTRFNVRAYFGADVREGVRAEHRSTIEPAANDLGDYRFTSQTSLRVAVSRRLGVVTTYTFNRDETPPPGVLFKDDRTLSVGLVVDFGKKT